MLWLFIGLAWADDSAEIPPPLTTAGEVRVLGVSSPDFPVDAEGHSVGQGFVLDTRVRGSLDLSIKGFRAGTEWDVLTGQIAGDTWDLPVDVDQRGRGELRALTGEGVVPRRANVGMRLAVVDIEAGLTTSQWGLGLLANDGANDPLFGRADGGDRVMRARATTAPFKKGGSAYPLYLTLAADMVVADDLARWADRQRAAQGIASVLYAKPDAGRLGTYVVYRNQRELDEARVTNVVVTDIAGDIPIPVGEWTLELAGELAVFAGRTDRALTYSSRDGLAVSAAGLLVHTALVEPGERLTVHLRGGWASGDGDADDGALHDFTADPNVDVGMVLFDELGGGVEVGTVGLLTDPQYAAQPPDGVDAIATEGAWRRSTFVQPAISGTVVTGVDLRAGVVLAWASAPIAQPFYTFRNGGTPTNHLDRATEGYAYGTELDWAVELGRGATEHWAIHPSLLVQGGHAFLANNWAGPGMPGRLDQLMVAARGRW
ncbi:MAG: hypothetical protein ACI8PZ_000601 [Myxococcota bacterium]|jgi:hypothetical protein